VNFILPKVNDKRKQVTFEGENNLDMDNSIQNPSPRLKGI